MATALLRSTCLKASWEKSAACVGITTAILEMTFSSKMAGSPCPPRNSEKVGRWVEEIKDARRRRRLRRIPSCHSASVN